MKTRDFIHKTKTKIMKTGGTLNFLKRTGAILMLLAIFVTSCNKYDDDFQSLKDAIAALDVKVNGVAQLQADLTAVKTQVTSVQTALGGLATTASVTTLTTNLAALATKVDALTTSLATVASTGTATKAVVDALKVDLAAVKADIAGVKTDLAAAKTALAAAIAAGDTKTQGDIAALQTAVLAQLLASAVTTDANVNAQITALKADIEAAITTHDASVAAKLTALESLITTENAATVVKIDDILAKLEASATTDATNAAVIAALQTALAQVQADVKQVLANTSMYVGDVILQSDADVDFYMTKVAQLSAVNGSLTITTKNISKLTDLNTITSSIKSVIGVGNVVLKPALGKSIDLSKLVTIAGNFTASGETTDATQSLINISALSSVSGSVTMDFDGPYASATLATVGGNLSLLKRNVGTSPTRVGTTSIDFPVISVSGVAISDGAAWTGPAAPPAIDYPIATKVVFGGQFTTFSAALATNVKITNTSYFTSKGSSFTDGVLIINAPSATTLDLSTMTKIGKTSTGLVITTAAGGTVDLSNFANYVNSTPTTFPMPVTITGPVSITIPKWAQGSLTCSTATAVNLGTYEWNASVTLPLVETLTVGKLDMAMTVPSSVKVATISGKTQTVYGSCNAAVTASSNTLTTLTLGGVLNSASVSSTGLTSLSTSGIVNALTVSGCTNTSLTGLALAHTHFPSGPGSYLKIVGNTSLTSLATSTDYPQRIEITGNTSLSSLNLTSNVNPISTTNGALEATYIIDGNKLSGTYVAAIPTLGADPYIEAKIKANVYLPIKALVAKALTLVVDGGLGLAAADVTLNLDLKDADPSSSTNSLATQMIADNNSVVVDNSVGIDTVLELALVTAE